MIGNRITTEFACILRPGDNTGKRLPAAIAQQLCQLAGAPILGAGRIFSLDRIERRRLWVIRCALIVTLIAHALPPAFTLLTFPAFSRLLAERPCRRSPASYGCYTVSWRRCGKRPPTVAIISEWQRWIR